MPLSEPTVRSSILRPMPAYLSARGVEIGPLLKEVDLVAGALADPQQLIPLNSAAQVFALAAQRLGDPAFGISYAKSFPLGGTGLLGHLMLSSPTVRDVFHVVTRYLEIHMTQMRTRFEEDKGIGLFTFAWPSTLTAPMLHYTGFYLASLIIRLRRATGENWQPLSAPFPASCTRGPRGLSQVLRQAAEVRSSRQRHCRRCDDTQQTHA